MKMDFDMELLYSMAPKATIHTLRARLESGRSIFEIIDDFRRRHGLASVAEHQNLNGLDQIVFEGTRV